MKIRRTLLAGTAAFALAGCHPSKSHNTAPPTPPTPERTPQKATCRNYLVLASLVDRDRASFTVSAAEGIGAAHCPQNDTVDILLPDNTALTDHRTVIGTIHKGGVFTVNCANNDPNNPLVGVKAGIIEGVVEYDINGYSLLAKDVPGLPACDIPAPPSTSASPSTR